MILECIQESVLDLHGRRMVFAPGEPIVMPDSEAIQVLLHLPTQVRLISPAPPNPGTHVSWYADDGQRYEGSVLLHFSFRGERWLLVLSHEQGWFVRESAVTSLDPGALFQAVHEAMKRTGTPEAKDMALAFLLTILGVPPNNPEAK